MTGATLSASYSGVRTDKAPQAAWFKYGTNANALTETVDTDDSGDKDDVEELDDFEYTDE